MSKKKIVNDLMKALNFVPLGGHKSCSCEDSPPPPFMI